MPRKKGSKNSALPRYRLHTSSGLAVVSVHGRDVYLGEYGSTESKQKYAEIVRQLSEEWQTPAAKRVAESPTVTVTMLIAAFWREVSTQCTPKEMAGFKKALSPLNALYGPTPAESFGPSDLERVREKMILSEHYCRNTINRYVHRIRRVFKFGVAKELLPNWDCYNRLLAVEAIRKSTAKIRYKTLRESSPVTPVGDDQVDRIRPYVSRQAWSLVQLLRLTGARAGEMVTIRARDIDMSGDVWLYEPHDPAINEPSHKTERFGVERIIAFGPKCQKILQSYLTGDPNAFLFSPAAAKSESVARRSADRKTPMSCGNRPGSRRKKKNPQRQPGGHYTTVSLGRAVRRACDMAAWEEWIKGKGVGSRQSAVGFLKSPPATANSQLPTAEFQKWIEFRNARRWHLHQLRHSMATEVSAMETTAEGGLNAARAVLGHKTVKMTALYAAIDQAKAVEVARRIG